jgi:tetratricopeptide (TPR) repeat protein
MRPEWGADSWVLEEYLKASQLDIQKHVYWRPLLGYRDYLSCLQLIKEKKKQEAQSSCEKALSYGPDETYIKKAISLYMDLGEFQKARKSIESLRTAFPSNYWDSVTQEYIDAFTRHAKTFDGKGKTSIAIQAYNEILHLFPGRADTLIARGNAHRSLGQWDSAEKDFLSVIARDPDHYSAYVGLDYTLAYQKRFREIVPFWKAYLSRNPQNSKAHYELGGTYFHLGDYENAYGAAQKACDLGHKEACQQAKRLKNR